MKKVVLSLLIALSFCIAVEAQNLRGGYNNSSPNAYNNIFYFHVDTEEEIELLLESKCLYMDFGLLLFLHIVGIAQNTIKMLVSEMTKDFHLSDILLHISVTLIA